jgi:heme/copper-type cytochrome/quinol oxidase subunit 2
MRSADVIHSFWIPRIGGKRDVNPLPRRREGEQPTHDNYLLFTVREPGHYLGQCAEYCGESHAIMRMTVIAVEPDEFDEWVQRMQRPAPGAGARAGAGSRGRRAVVGADQVPDPAAGAVAAVPSVTPGQLGGTVPPAPQAAADGRSRSSR